MTNASNAGQPGRVAGPAPKFQRTTGVVVQPARIVVYGWEGLGKSSIGRDSPDPVHVDLEDNTGHLLIANRWRLPPANRNVRDIFELLDCAARDLVRPGMTLVVDGFGVLDAAIAAEVLAEAEPCYFGGDRDGGKRKPMELDQVGGGWNAWRGRVAKRWHQALAKLEMIQARTGCHLLLLGHAGTDKQKNPGGEEFTRWAPQVEKGAAVMLRDWCEGMFFLCRDVVAAKPWAKAETQRRPTMGDVHILRTRRSAGWDAKNRWGLPEWIEASGEAIWGARARYYDQARAGVPVPDSDLLAELEDVLSCLPETMRVDAKGVPLIETARVNLNACLLILNRAKVAAERHGKAAAPSGEAPAGSPQEHGEAPPPPPPASSGTSSSGPAGPSSSSASGESSTPPAPAGGGNPSPDSAPAGGKRKRQSRVKPPEPAATPPPNAPAGAAPDAGTTSDASPEPAGAGVPS